MYSGLGQISQYDEPGFNTPAVVGQIQAAVAEGKDFYQTINDLLNPSAAAARRAAEVAAKAQEDQRADQLAVASVAPTSPAPLMIAGLAVLGVLALLKGK
ncbi:MAG: hypothetical protein GY906_22880 [bacterium]|nr:hypothetical protein [bacterium]